MKLDCDINGLEPIVFISELISKSYMIEKYGSRPLKKEEVSIIVEEKQTRISSYKLELPPKVKKTRKTTAKKKQTPVIEEKKEEPIKPRKRTLTSL